MAGAGVAGGVIASGLAAIPGVEVLAFERVGPEDHALAGNGLNIGPNAILAARHALPAFADRLTAASLPWRAWSTSTMAGAPLYRIPLDEVAACDGIRVRWAELYRVCREGARAAGSGVLRFDTDVVDVRVTGDGPGSVALAIARAGADGEPGRPEWIDGIDLVVAADGRFSRLRQALCGPIAMRHLGVANLRCLLDDGGALPLDDFEQWHNGPNRFIAFRLHDGLIYLSGNFPIASGAEIAPEQKQAPFLRAAYTPADGRMADVPRWLLESACADVGALHWARNQESAPCWHDASGRVVFPGDAGHGMAPTLGQGATLAIEDACVFIDQFRRAAAADGVPGIDVPRLVRRFAETRAERVAFIARFSWEASDALLHGADAEALCRKKDGPDYRAKLRRTYALPDFG